MQVKYGAKEKLPNHGDNSSWCRTLENYPYFLQRLSISCLERWKRKHTNTNTTAYKYKHNSIQIQTQQHTNTNTTAYKYKHNSIQRFKTLIVCEYTNAHNIEFCIAGEYTEICIVLNDTKHYSKPSQDWYNHVYCLQSIQRCV